MSISPAEYERRRSAHVCVRCKTPVEKYVLCAPCRKSDSDRYARQRDERNAAHACTLRGGARDGKFQICAECRNIRAIKARAAYVPVAVDHRRRGLTKRWPQPAIELPRATARLRPLPKRNQAAKAA